MSESGQKSEQVADEGKRQWVFRGVCYGDVIGEVEPSPERKEKHRFAVKTEVWESGAESESVVEIELVSAGLKKRFNLRVPASQARAVAELMREACVMFAGQGVLV